MTRLTRDEDCWLKIFGKLHTWNGDADLSTWISVTARRVALMAIRSAKSRPREAMSFDDTVTTDGGEAVQIEPEYHDKFLATIGEFNDLYNAIDQLTPAQQHVVKLWLEGLEFREIARRLHIGEPTAKSNMSRATQELKRIMEGKMSTAPVPVPDQGEHFTQSTEAPNSTQTHSLALCPCGRPVRHRGRCKGSKAAGGRTKRLTTMKAAIDKPEAPATQTGNSLTLKLQCGAKLNITLDGNWFYLTENDRRVVFGILDRARQMGA